MHPKIHTSERVEVSPQTCAVLLALGICRTDNDEIAFERGRYWLTERTFEGHELERAVNWLYRILDTIDNKIERLLTVSAILGALYGAFILHFINKNIDLPDVQGVGYFTAQKLEAVITAGIFTPFILIFWAILLSIECIKIRWPFLGFVRRPRTTLELFDLWTQPPPTPTFVEELCAVGAVCDQRASSYRVVSRLLTAALWLAAIGIAGIIFLTEVYAGHDPARVNENGAADAPTGCSHCGSCAQCRGSRP